MDSKFWTRYVRIPSGHRTIERNRRMSKRSEGADESFLSILIGTFILLAGAAAVFYAAYKVSSLEKKGYLKRVRSKTDKREYYLQVTRKYIDYYRIVSDNVNSIIKKAKQRMTPEQWEGFCSGLEVIKAVQIEADPNLVKAVNVE